HHFVQVDVGKDYGKTAYATDQVAWNAAYSARVCREGLPSAGQAEGVARLEFSLGGVADIHDFEYEAQMFARERVIAIDRDTFLSHCRHDESARLPVRRLSFERLTAAARLGRNLFDRDGHQQVRVAYAVALFRRQRHFDLGIDTQPLERCFDFWKGAA